MSTVIDTINVGTDPVGVAVSTNGSTRLRHQPGNNTVSVIYTGD